LNKEEILAKLQDVFDKVFLDPVKVTFALSAKDVPEWDSLTHISLVVAVEKTFGVRFRMGQVEKAQNVGEFVEIISKLLAEKTSK
jgi:acyl carrier protein